ncbi:hypothetical protein ACIA8C_32070 [Nocardia sp. NPDC051321]|uniref:hypothetical protein n=1 Tax=Nocardia sp. NPDC051321 TaxID=3364323 RepID=UPI0037A290A2
MSDVFEVSVAPVGELRKFEDMENICCVLWAGCRTLDSFALQRLVSNGTGKAPILV